MVVPIHLQPLRERAGDLPLLATHFLETFAEQNRKAFTGFSQEAMSAILNYPWPGNVRELENVIERIVVLQDGPTVTLTHLPGEVAHYRRKPQPVSDSPHAAPPLSEIVKEAIRDALVSSGGNVSEAAKELDLPEDTVREKAVAYGLDTRS